MSNEFVLPWDGYELPRVRSWSEFVDLSKRTADMDAVLRISESITSYHVPDGQHYGVNIFGPACASNPLLKDEFATVTTRQIDAFVLNDAVLMPNSMVVLNRFNKLHQPSAENLTDARILSTYDWHFAIERDNMTLTRAFYENLTTSNSLVTPICGPGFPNYGHFLFDGLAGVMQLKEIVGPDLKLTGQHLTPWQSEILHILGLLEHYLRVEKPVRFRKMFTTSMLSLHLRVPTHFCRMAFDAIRFRVPRNGERGPKKVFLSRGNSKKRICINRSEIEALAARMGFVVLHTDTMSVAEQVQAMRNAEIIVGEGGAGLANIGFCSTGALVLEINVLQDPWVRSTCFHLGQKWHGFFPETDMQTPNGTPDWDGMRFEIGLNDFAGALETIMAKLP